jgi:hypothetical protein
MFYYKSDRKFNWNFISAYFRPNKDYKSPDKAWKYGSRDKVPNLHA